MKKFLFFLFATSIAVAQTNTEVYLFELKHSKGNWTVGNGKNISNNPGYDSPPYFYSKMLLFFHQTETSKLIWQNTI